MNISSTVSASAPRCGSALLALLCAGGAVALGVSQEAPLGQVRGRVLREDGRQPMAGVRVTLTSWDAQSDGVTMSDEADGEIHRLRAVTDGNGEFWLPRVRAGAYRLAAATRAHAGDETDVWVGEDATSDVPLELERSEPDLAVAQQQKNFLSSEPMIVPVRGYVDGAKAAGRDNLRVRIFRTRLADVLRDPKAAESLARVGNRYDDEQTQTLPRALLHPAQGQAPRLLSSRAMPITEADGEGFFHQRLKLGAPGAGLYLMDATHGGKTVSAWMLVSDTALVVKQSRRDLLAYSVDARSGAPRSGAAIRVFRAGRVVAATKSDAQGMARIALPAGDSGQLMTLATLGAHEATVGQYDGGEESEGRGEFTAHAYTDRPIYRPGGRVFYKGIVRRALEPGIRYTVPDGEPVAVEIRDPSGERVLREEQRANRFGSFAGNVELSPEAPTGTYTVVMTVRGEEHTADFTVASYRKPEFTATVAPNQKRYTRGETVEMFVAASYYFGAPVAGAKVKYTVLRAPDWAARDAADYGDEDDEDAGEYENEYGGSGEMVQEGAATLDENGHAIIRFTAAQADEKSGAENSEGEADSDFGAPQEQVYTAQVTVVDASGRETEAEGAARVAAGDFRLTARPAGYVAAPDQPSVVTITAKDFEGRPVKGATVELESGYQKWSAASRKSEYEMASQQRAVTGDDGTARVTITPPRAGELRLKARARDAKGRAIEDETELWVTGEDGGDLNAQYGDLSLLTDKKRYRAGETARVLVNTERAGQTALLCIEGPKIFRAWLVPLRRKSTVLRVPVLAGYGPNVFLTACAVRDKKFARSEAPLRVDVPQREIKVAIRADRAKYRPGDKVTYQVQTTDARGAGVPCEFSFGVVDEAIYALREDDPRALRDAFYPRRYNAVSTAYSFEPQYLGDANKAEPSIEARKKFLDTAFWQPALQTDGAGRATVSFALPDNLTTWRATAIAQTADTALGRRTQKSVVAKDFFVRLETPRFLTGGDASQIVALLHNETAQPQTATVKLDAAGLQFGGDATQTVTIAPHAIGQAVWPVSSDANGLDFSGTARLKVVAWTQGDSSGAQLTDGVEMVLPVRPRGREQLQAFAGQVGAGQSVTQQISIDRAAIPAAGKVSIRITPSVTDALVGALEYLADFPYGCTEQTMSRFLPDIFVQRTLRLSGRTQSASDRALRQRLPIMVRDGLSRLYRFQHDSGGWGWWEADGGDPWMTAYVLYGLAQARDEGYAVSGEVLSRGREAATKLLKNGAIEKLPAWQQSNAENTRAFLLYALALSADSPNGDAAFLRAQRRKMKPSELDAQALAWLVLLDKKLGVSSGAAGAETAWAELEKQLVADDDGMLHWKGSGRDDWADWNDKTATALGLQAMLANNRNDPRIGSVLLWLMTRRSGDSWDNTRDTAWALAALCDYLRGQNADANSGAVNSSGDAANGSAAGGGEVLLRLNGRPFKRLALATDAARGGDVVVRLPWQSLRAGVNKLSLERRGGGAIFYSIQARQTIGGDNLPAAPNSGIKITREYRRVLARAAGGNRWTLQTEPTNNDLKSGGRIRVRLTFDVPRDLSYVLIEDAFPSGCEVTERGSADEGNEDWDNWWSSTDVRDDRVAFFARRMAKGRHVIEYNLRAQTPGSYRALPTMLQAMYAPQVRAESVEAHIQVR